MSILLYILIAAQITQAALPMLFKWFGQLGNLGSNKGIQPEYANGRTFSVPEWACKLHRIILFVVQKVMVSNLTSVKLKSVV